MTQRVYTVADIGALRSALQNMYLWGRYSGPSQNTPGGADSRVYNESEMKRDVEDKVRTYMLAGITADELYASERPQKQA